MPRFTRIALLGVSVTPFLFAFAQQGQGPAQEPLAEGVFKNIQVFKGVPADDLIPAMEFMSASLKFECSDCHDMKDFAADTRNKETARKMILMQRDINTKNFNGRLEVTCFTCHSGMEHPAGTPIPGDVKLRHARIDNPPKPEEIFAKHVAAAGTLSAPIELIGTLTAPNEQTHKLEVIPIKFYQAGKGKFAIKGGDKNVVSNGKDIWYGSQQMFGEGAAIFGRIGRSWYGPDLFSQLQRPLVSGKDEIGKSSVIAVRGARPTTMSTEDLSFDSKSGLLVRMVNLRRSTLGTVVSSVDYMNYKKVSGAMVPMKVTATFADGSTWTMDFKAAKVNPKIPDEVFRPGA